jgi:hypothetical protein
MAKDSKIDLGKFFDLPDADADVETENKVLIPDRTIFNAGLMLFAVIAGAILVNGIVRNASK